MLILVFLPLLFLCSADGSTHGIRSTWRTADGPADGAWTAGSSGTYLKRGGISQ
jgi:hypothetical protein